MCNDSIQPQFSPHDVAAWCAAGASLDAKAYRRINQLLAKLALHSDYTEKHCQRVAAHTHALATNVGLPLTAIRALAETARLHDIGKLQVPSELLDKPALTREELAYIRQHAEFGPSIIEAQSDLPEAFRSFAAHTILFHHRRMDNTGYPAVLDGIKVPISSQFIAVIDSYDAMTDGNRPYNSHTAFTKEQALNRLGELRDGFDPGVRSAYTNMLLAPTHLPFGLPLPSQTFAAQPGGL